MKKLYYLASPYSHESKDVREERFRDVCIVAADLFAKGMCVFSPIAHTHPLIEHGLDELNKLKHGWESYAEFDRLMISKCDGLIVLQLDGWEESEGIKEEIKIALGMGKSIEYVHPLAILVNLPPRKVDENSTTHR